MATKFEACQSVEIPVPYQPIPIKHYLRQPERLVNALVDSSRIEQLSPEVFRLKMRPLSFISLSIQPIVDMRVWALADGTILLESVGSEIRGIEYINQRFQLDLKGHLSSYDREGNTYLKGIANLEVKVELPPLFSFTPKSILEATGNGLLKSVLVTIKQRLLHQLLVDYRHWVESHSLDSYPDDSNDFTVLKPE
ncbi:DUF1997 domain-containing protein [Rivularia sp. UHCC 0363]|uniref:DUF1997 domain-containing protein n=1 Tax=Rivularia sp. UHCC 0363 TaxID=3110244 RepID=UPI002B1E9F62|nr:DUF1997 domain-containing protein [Rivularia sp. UHCC 0363]MEA5593925.1 DUF1997 domain-containing protein [Rivularia sp. UHCC 0363]